MGLLSGRNPRMLVLPEQRHQDPTKRNNRKTMKQQYAPACAWHIRIGNLFIAPSMKFNSGKIYIGRVDKDEGDEFDAAALAPILAKFYQDNLSD